MSTLTLPGDPPIDVTVRRSSRARRISLRVSGVDGRVSLTLPHGVPEREGLAFAREKAAWLRGHLDRQPEPARVGIGTLLPVEGRALRIVPGTGRRIVVGEDALHVPGPEDRAGVRVRSWLRTLARERLADASDHYAGLLGRPHGGLTLRDTRSRWGSCSAEGRLNYSWRLILAPGDVLDYVAAHEVAHLAEMNHSRAFWDTVARLKPGYETPRRWLRENGTVLHRFRFDG